MGPNNPGLADRRLRCQCGSESRMGGTSQWQVTSWFGQFAGKVVRFRRGVNWFYVKRAKEISVKPRKLLKTSLRGEEICLGIQGACPPSLPLGWSNIKWQKLTPSPKKHVSHDIFPFIVTKKYEKRYIQKDTFRGWICWAVLTQAQKPAQKNAMAKIPKETITGEYI